MNNSESQSLWKHLGAGKSDMKIEKKEFEHEDLWEEWHDNQHYYLYNNFEWGELGLSSPCVSAYSAFAFVAAYEAIMPIWNNYAFYMPKAADKYDAQAANYAANGLDYINTVEIHNVVTTLAAGIKTVTFGPLLLLTLMAPFGFLKELTAMGWTAAYKVIGPVTDAMYMASMVFLAVQNKGFGSDQIYDFIYQSAFFAFEKSLLSQNYYSLQANLLGAPAEEIVDQVMAQCVFDEDSDLTGSFSFSQVEGEKIMIQAMI